MDYFITIRGLIALVIMTVLSLWLARMLQRKRRGMPFWVSALLTFILLFEPGGLAFYLWEVHDAASSNGALMIHAYTFLKAGAFIFILFILPSIFFAWQFYLRPSPRTIKPLRFGILLPIAFAAVTFLEAPRMIWGDRAELITSETFILVLTVVAINLALFGLTFLQRKKTD